MVEFMYMPWCYAKRNVETNFNSPNLFAWSCPQEITKFFLYIYYNKVWSENSVGPLVALQNAKDSTKHAMCFLGESKYNNYQSNKNSLPRNFSEYSIV